MYLAGKNKYVIFVVIILCFLCCFSLFYPNFAAATGPSINSSGRHIFDYLNRVSAEVTHRSLSNINTLHDWLQVRDQRYEEFVEMMSLTDVPLKGKRPPLNVVYVDTLQMEGFHIEKLYYESLPHLYVVANLYVPDNIIYPVPAILYSCGHAKTQKVYYQAHPRKFAQLGFVCLIIETIQWGEARGHHWGPYNKGWFQWYSRGYMPGGVDAWNGIRGLDLLCQRSEVDTSKLGVTGNSGGGTQSWYIAALDPRIKASASSCGTGTVESHVRTKDINNHCDCMMPINTYLRDFHDIGALIAPRPHLIVSTKDDPLFEIEAARQCYEYVKKIYTLYGAADKLYFVETPGGHGYNEISRPGIFSFFMKHLMNKDVQPSQVGDVDESDSTKLSAQELRVYVEGPPLDDITTTIQETFVKLAEIPQITDMQSLESHKQIVTRFLRRETFRAFPAQPIPFDTILVFSGMDGIFPDTTIFNFASEKEWRLKVDLRWQKSPASSNPVMLVLRSPDEDSLESEIFMSGLNNRWNIAYFDVRGVGETAWSWKAARYIRRAAAWSGRTVASMRVYDVLRCLEVLRSLEGVDAEKIAIAAKGEMCAIALYAALLDENITAVLLKNPPATQNAPSDPIGRGEAVEMLNCLRITDLPQVAGLLFPKKIAIIDSMPQSYEWARSLYQILGKTNNFKIIDKISDWVPVTYVDDFVPYLISDFELQQNYPNPFNSTTTVMYNLLKNSKVILKIYNLPGKEIRTLVDENQPAGKQSITWDGRNNFGKIVGSGIYVYKLGIDNKIQSKKMLFLK